MLRRNYIAWILLSVMAVLIGLYPSIYFLIDRNFGLLQSKSEYLLSNVTWNLGFYSHIILGAVALLVGWIQFNARLRARRMELHRKTGMLYVVAALLSAMAGMYIAFFATGGIVAALGFTGLGITWFCTTLLAFLQIKKGNIQQHQRMMIFSYAACFSAVTLRIWLPILVAAFNDFTKAYMVVAWLCWIPNMVVAFFLVNGLKKQQRNLIPVSDKRPGF